MIRWGHKTIGIVAIGLVVGSAAASTPAGASPRRPAQAKVEVISFTTARQTVTTSTGQKLHLVLDGTSEAEPHASNAVNIHVRLALPNGVESHTWSFLLTAASFADSHHNGHARLKTTSSEFSPYGQINLGFTQSGAPHTVACGKSSVTTYREAIDGRLAFHTNSTGAHPWGSVGAGSAHFRMTGSLRVQRGDNNCTTPPPTPCVHTTGWSEAPGAIFVTGIGGDWTLVNGVKVGSIDGSRSVPLSTPTLASRADEVTVKAPAPVLHVHAGLPTLSVTTTGGYATGSATLSSTTAETPTTVACGVHHHMRQRIWSFASYTNGTTPLTIHEHIEGPITLADEPQSGTIVQDFP